MAQSIIGSLSLFNGKGRYFKDGKSQTILQILVESLLVTSSCSGVWSALVALSNYGKNDKEHEYITRDSSRLKSRGRIYCIVRAILWVCVQHSFPQ